MAKEVGFAFTVAIDDATPSAQTLSNDITSFNFEVPRGVLDVTGMDKSARERLLLLADFTALFNGVFNTAANQSHDVFKTVPSSSAVRTVTLTINSKVLATECVATDYPLTRAADGSLVWAVPMALQNGAVPTWA